MPTLKINTRLQLVHPSSIDKVGDEMLTLAGTLGLLGKAEINKITDVARQGFAYNFATEGSADGDWSELADWTQREREELGFHPTHPILQRTKEYKRSWVDRGHRHHWQQFETWPYMAQGIDVGLLDIEVGSDDPRVPALSGGSDAMMADLTSGLSSEFDELLVGGSGGGHLPPRPVAPIKSMFVERLGTVVEMMLTLRAFRVR